MSRLALPLFVALAIVAGGSGVAGDASEPSTRLDCGVNSLFILLNLEGKKCSYEALERALPPRDPRGYSMAELRAAAGRLGLPLDGIAFDPKRGRLDRPVIAFFKDGKDGHFAVLNPVGTTGTMVQVIDPPHVPRIVDIATLSSTKPWTGRVLARGEWPIWPLVGAVAITAALVATRRRGKTATQVVGKESPEVAFPT